MIGRRGLLASAAALLGTAATGRAQSRRTRRIVVIAPNAQQLARLDVFLAAMGERAPIDGGAAVVTTRFATDHPGGAGALAAEVVAEAPDIVVAANTPIVHAMLATKTEIPVVIAVVGDRAGTGVAQQRPGQNVTGVTTLVGGMAAKRLALLKEAAPRTSRVLSLYHPDDPIHEPQLRDIAEAAPGLGVSLRSEPVREPAEIDRVFAEARAWGADAVFRLAGQTATTTRRTIELALAGRLPTMLVLQEDARQGGLMSYYASFEEHWERVAVLVDRILKGTPARELPIEQPTRFELVLNLKTARAIGLSLSPAFIARADEVIE